MHPLKSLFSETGEMSMTRVIAFFVTLVIMGTWMITCLSKMNFEDIPWGVVSVLAIVITGKTVQRFAEGPTELNKNQH